MRIGRPLRAVLVALALGSGLLAAPGSSVPVASGVGPRPDCRLDDIFTEPRGYDDWEITLVDWILTLGPDYKPPDLVSVSKADVAGGGLIREVAIDDLKAMAAAARKNGSPIKVLSPYRGYKQQVDLFRSYAGANGQNFEDAITFSARPGHSEHQTGLTIDFGSIGDTGLTSNWEVTRAGGWMAKNAWKYGWLMSYPDGKDALVCYHYEPWHYRYVGRELAAKIHDSGLTIREYLWANYTQVDAACVALPAPTVGPKTKPKPRSCALTAPSPTASPGEPAAPSTSGGSPSVPTSGPSTGGAPLPSPGATAAPSPAGSLDRAMPIGVALVALVVVMLGFVLWRSSRRRARYR
jgi:LAS superfamily LD-carboxypeptidase LdcB